MLWMSQGKILISNNMKFVNSVRGLKKVYLFEIVCSHTVKITVAYREIVAGIMPSRPWI